MDVVDDATGILARIDAATVANLCGCGCGHQIPDDNPSPDFVNEAHQQRWNNRGRTGEGLTEGGAATLSNWEHCATYDCDHVRHILIRTETVTKQRTTLRRAIDRIRGIIR